VRRPEVVAFDVSAVVTARPCCVAAGVGLIVVAEDDGVVEAARIGATGPASISEAVIGEDEARANLDGLSIGLIE
jgi:hypothetical protein